MTVLVPMSAEVFKGYVENAVAGYARDNVESGRWPPPNEKLVLPVVFICNG